MKLRNATDLRDCCQDSLGTATSLLDQDRFWWAKRYITDTNRFVAEEVELNPTRTNQMPRRYLFGPVSRQFAAENLWQVRESGHCLAFDIQDGLDLTIGRDDTWQQIEARLPDGWRPDFLVLYLQYRIVPEVLWDVSMPVVGLAGDWKLLWHGYRRQLRRCDLVLADAVGSDLMNKEGIHSRTAILFGGERSFAEANWREQLEHIDREWPNLCERPAKRPIVDAASWLATRALVALSSADSDTTLLADLTKALEASPRSASLANALGVTTMLVTNNKGDSLIHAANAFQQGWISDPSHAMTGVNLTGCLIALGKKPEATEQAQRTLAVLDGMSKLDNDTRDDAHFPPVLDTFRIEWERAAWQQAGNREAEAAEKLRLLRWRLHAILAELSDDLVHYYEAAALRPDLLSSQAALGCALAKRGRFFEASDHLRKALIANPFDVELARMFFHLLGDMGNTVGQQQLVMQRRLMHKESPKLVPLEPWFADPRADFTEAIPVEPPLRIAWEGSQLAVHSLALVNREICSRLLEHGHELTLLPPKMPDYGLSAVSGYQDLAAWQHKLLSGPAEVHVAHQWPPCFEPPLAGHWVIIQHWEFGSLPVSWIKPMTQQVDELWVASHFVRDCYIKSGIPANQVFVIPLAVSALYFEPNRNAIALKTSKNFKFLFVGGTIYRKGIDVLLKTYGQSFSDCDDVCLVIKDMGVGSFYQGQTAQRMIDEFRKQPHAPEIEYLDRELTSEEMAGLYAACHCLVHPYRGEGFGLPIAEAMALGLPVIVTGYGAALDFCNSDNAFLIRARIRHFREKRIDTEPTVDLPWLAEPDNDTLRYLLRYVVKHPDEARAKGQKAREHIRAHFTWEHSTALVEQRLRHLRHAPIRRFDNAQPKTRPYTLVSGTNQPKVSLCLIVKNEENNLAECLKSVADLVNEVVVVDTGSADRTKEIAVRLGAKVFDFPWVDSFAAARNETLRYATGMWIFWMDADDRLDEENRTKLRKLFATLPDENAAYVMKCLCLPDPETRTATVVDHIRLFRNHPQIRWKYRVHEQILPGIRQLGGTVRWSDVVIQHVGYLDKELRVRKRQRDLRLLAIENEENPNDPFTLFNLGSIHQEQGEMHKALEVLQRSLELSHPNDSIVRKLYAMIAQCQRHLGDHRAAQATCQAGRTHYPDDVELQFQEGLAWKSLGQKDSAIACFERLLNSSEGNHFASVDTGLRGYKARHNLAVLYQEQGRFAEAESTWREALDEQPAFIPALVGLGELNIAQRKWQQVETVLARLEQFDEANLDRTVLRARMLLARKELPVARRLLEEAILKHPQVLYPRVILSHVLLQSEDWAAAETALDEVLRFDPNNMEAKRNLVVLQRQLGKT